MLKSKFATFWLAFLLLTSTISAAGLPVKLKAKDTPNDKGGSITIIFESLPQDTTEVEYEILRSAEKANSFQLVGRVSSKDTKFVDTNVKDGVKYHYLLQVVKEDDVLFSAVSGPVVSRGQWFHTQRINVLLGVIISFLFILGFVLYGKRGKKLYIRPIAGLQAVDSAIGRATEMGKPILYSSGLGKMDRVATMASMNILSSVAEKTAEYNTPLIFPNYDPVVMTTAQEVVFEAYSKAGHPEAYNPDNIFFVTQSQFGYAAAVDGIMTRQLPATNLFFGTFEAEALILAETGNSVGALQIAGTDSTIQLSFFIVACDYTLIGEELFVASGYLTKDPQILGSIKGQDWLKAIIVVLILIGGIAGILGFKQFIELFNVG
ncbi:MAG: hypothetical protein KAX39_05760 [candidate division Zixibacteria bacterium]|nr:hypothetical protein [candidate division Zixibacteria bacterium]